MFSVLSAVLEPFLLIALGYALRGTKRFGAKELWDGVEKLVFWVLFPPLLFNSVAHAKLTGLDTAEFLLFGTLAMATGVFMAKAVSKMAPADPMTDASVRQTGYRFNSYICFALALNMYGQEALALVALLTGIWVPISNAIAVADLSYAAKTGSKTSIGSIVKSIFTNPLIVSTLAGLFANILTHLTGFQVPNFLTKIFSSLGSASMATALLAIGAGLAVGLANTQTAALMCYAVVPTANSCYIMAARMGGNGPVVSDLTSVEVLVSLATIPMWCMALQAFVF